MLLGIYWQLRSVLIGAGSLICISVFIFFRQPLFPNNSPLVAAIFLAGATLVIIGCVWDFFSCHRERKELIPCDFPVKRLFELYSSALQLRQLALAASIATIAFCSMSVIIADADKDFILMGKLCALIAICSFWRSFQRDHISRRTPH